MKTALSSALAETAKKQAASTTKLIGERTSLINASYAYDKKIADREAKREKARNDGRVEEEAKLNEEIVKLKEQRVEADEQAGKKTGEIWMAAGMQVGASFAQMILEGENATKAMVLSSLDALQAMIPYFVTMIFGEYASLGPWMLLAAAGVTAGLYALAGLARAAASKYLYTGGINEWGGINHYGLLSPGHKVIHLNDDGTGRPEFVFNPKTTRKNLADFTKINSLDISLDEYVRRYRPDIVKNNAVEIPDVSSHLSSKRREMNNGYALLDQMRRDGLIYGKNEIVSELKDIKKQNGQLIEIVEKQNAIIKTKTKLINNFKDTGKVIRPADLRGRY